MLLERSAALDLASHIALEQALYREARLLDEERFAEWLEMTTEDVAYRMALRSRRFRKDRSGDLPIGTGMIFDEDRARLCLRIDRLRSGYVWAEDPINFVRRIVSNVEIAWPDADDAEGGGSDDGEGRDWAEVHSVVTIHRSRINNQTRTLVAGRKDRWRRGGGAWRLARRDCVLDHSTIPDSNLNVFF
ncbi:aromatic-ring-hydroxylating dioxygenase subunit beta [Sphingomonas sp.]|uniref:aromatic-ring-hydroxylating dioxygenase subunit beta n=1 Tax=Sphingomonas sp. TaxID=28214 RepID=UPI002FCB22F2